MNIIQYLETAKAQIKAEEERQVAIVRDRVTNAVQPKYAEIEKLKNEKLTQLALDYDAHRKLVTEQYNNQLIAMQSKFETDQRTVIEGADNKKNEILTSILASETYPITKECEKAIAKLDSQIKELKE